MEQTQYVDKEITTYESHEMCSLEPVSVNLLPSSEIIEVEKEEIQTEPNYYPKFEYSKDWSEDDAYLLAKIVMAEAEGESIQGKTLVILVILNRVWSDEFPNTIRDVIYQRGANGTYQFSPIGDGRFERLEPNEDCWEAVKIVEEAIYDYSGGALYFEACEDNDNWHSRNLQFLYQEGSHRFYK